MGRRSTSTLTSGNLSNQQKYDICKHAADNPSKSQKELSAWAKQTFRLAKAPSQSTISNTLRKRKTLLSMKTTDLACKRTRVIRFPELDRALANWVLHSMQTDLRVTGELIKMKAERFAELLNIKESCDLVFSNGWLTAFKERHGLKSRQCHGESGSVCRAAVEDALPLVMEKTSRYASRNIYNFDESGLFYELAPDRTIAARAVKGTKKSKSRITIAFAVNADGSDKREPLFIGNALRPRCFNKKFAVELGLSYENNKKAWMNGLVFQRWLKRFDRDMKDQHRHVLLLLDNASSHTVAGLELGNIEIAFLPLNTTSELQPLDAGIISSFKRHYRRLHLEHALHREEQGEKKIYAVDVLQAMRWAKLCWTEITSEIVQNCWQHTRILGGDALLEKKKSRDEQAIEDRTSQCLRCLRISNPMPIDEIVSPRDEDNVHVGVEGADFVAVAIEEQDE